MSEYVGKWTHQNDEKLVLVRWPDHHDDFEPLSSQIGGLEPDLSIKTVFAQNFDAHSSFVFFVNAVHISKNVMALEIWLGFSKKIVHRRYVGESKICSKWMLLAQPTKYVHVKYSQKHSFRAIHVKEIDVGQDL